MFTHLHTHSHYSLLDGLPKIDELIAAAKKHTMKALALTDHGVMYGAIEFYQKAKAAGIKPIIGIEAYVARHGKDKKRPKIDEKPYHIILLAKNNQGYKNLCFLTTIAHLEGFYYKPRIDSVVLKQYSKGIIALSGCIQGEIPQCIISNQLDKAEKALLTYKEIFGNDFYLEIQDHPGLDRQTLVNKALIKLSKKHKVELVATADLHYIDESDKQTQDILLCIQTKKKKADKDRLCMLDDEYSFHSAQEMMQRFKKHPEAIENTQKIADRCNVEIELGKIKLPYFPIPEGNRDDKEGDGKSADQYLKDLCEKKLSDRYPRKTPHLRASEGQAKEIKKRLEYELSVIKKTGFASYFLIVQDFVNWAKNNGIVVGPGRGSVGGSIVSYILNITNIDPLQYDLLFERFMVLGRIAPPDIDLDFADTRRDEVINYVEDKYGKDHVAQIITFGTMAARAAIRDVGRVLDYPYAFCDKLAKTVPFNTTLNKALAISPELKELYQTNEDAKTILDMAKKLEGVVRHASKHACGVVITPEPLTSYMPIQYDVADKQTIISQYEMHAIEDLGLLKMDFLGLKNLTVIENAVKIIKALHGISINIDEIPLDDKKTFAMLKKAQTKGVFQLDGSGMRRYLEQLKPTALEDIITMIALYRPGPMELIPEYIGRKQGKKKITYLHPKLKPILEKTYGIAVFQEQILQIARDLAGFTLTEADVLRKAVGKKIPKLLKKQKQKFINGCIKNNIPKTTAEKIFAFIEPFAGYAFNLAHSTCYAMIAYQTAYLKANYTTEFMAALLTADQNDIDRIGLEVEECKKMNIEILPPDINESYENFTVVESTSSEKNKQGRIRFGLLAIKNVGKGIAKSIIDEREENGSYQNLEDFLSRVLSKDLNKKSLESLIKSGAMDELGERGQMLENITTLTEFARKKQKDKEQGQTTLFGILPVGGSLSLKLKKTSSAKHQQKLLWEKELLGLFISSHPLQEYEKLIQKYATPISRAKNDIPLQNHMHNNKVKIVGIITNIKKVTTSNSQTMIFVKVSDPTGEIEAIVFPNIFKAHAHIWEENNIVSISGRLSDKDGVPKIIAQTVKQVNKDTLDEWLLKGK
ncbi:DNA polymerase III subunit alpha [Patescibacteria group bacterium AH-259-L07]|nr:DNA polymerase III subunit alpha [Patescibacteria group bacterium AH-259-L07]